MMLTTIATILTKHVEHEHETLAQFQTKLGEDAYEAFYWGAEAISAAASLRVMKRALALAKAGADVEAIAISEMRAGVGNLSNAASPIEGVMRSETLRAWMRVVDICAGLRLGAAEARHVG